MKSGLFRHGRVMKPVSLPVTTIGPEKFFFSNGRVFYRIDISSFESNRMDGLDSDRRAISKRKAFLESQEPLPAEFGEWVIPWCDSAACFVSVEVERATSPLTPVKLGRTFTLASSLKRPYPKTKARRKYLGRVATAPLLRNACFVCTATSCSFEVLVRGQATEPTFGIARLSFPFRNQLRRRASESLAWQRGPHAGMPKIRRLDHRRPHQTVLTRSTGVFSRRYGTVGHGPNIGGPQPASAAR